jgi:hypothetical protein
MIGTRNERFTGTQRTEIGPLTHPLLKTSRVALAALSFAYVVLEAKCRQPNERRTPPC